MSNKPLHVRQRRIRSEEMPSHCGRLQAHLRNESPHYDPNFLHNIEKNDSIARQLNEMLGITDPQKQCFASLDGRISLPRIANDVSPIIRIRSIAKKAHLHLLPQHLFTQENVVSMHFNLAVNLLHFATRNPRCHQLAYEAWTNPTSPLGRTR